MAAQDKRNIVIIGGGIIGCTTAYFLSHHPTFSLATHSITLLEATDVASAASGKAGGLLALWAYPNCLVPLSFRLHAELAERHDGVRRWGYRHLHCGSISATVTPEKLASFADKSPRRGDGAPAENTDVEPAKDWEKLPKQSADAVQLLQEAGVPLDLDWVDPETLDGYCEMGRPGATKTAQVHPFQFTTAIAELAREEGVDIRTGAQVTQIKTSDGGVDSIEYRDRKTGEVHVLKEYTDVVVVVFEAEVSPWAIFTDIALPRDYVPPHRAKKGQKRKHKRGVDPEIYARPNNEVYACGEPDSAIPLPETADLVQTDPDQCEDLVAYISTISPALRAAPVKARQACYLPRHMRSGDERGPLIGPTLTPGLWVAAGHTCWGIQNGPATGYLMAQYILEGKASAADIAELDPRTLKV
ncbi:unnamed protein product [Parascedosporium putredinis]|uniref:FAD dependent oxidoreductase domain-containing protein n=1 Tax=Parascedosporium putredinis TaxID=1442378 RepID=A0A9P1M8M8_9PEZI|nr:unnamed protein product [Parascedosporium putredinis]CAI7993016.1 unnamed protein product [Parascedosporium putredinis]